MNARIIFLQYICLYFYWSRRIFFILNRFINRLDAWDAYFSCHSSYTSTPKKVINTYQGIPKYWLYVGQCILGIELGQKSRVQFFTFFKKIG